MKVGIFIGEIQPEQSGGGATFQSSVLEELLKTKSQHNFYLFYQSEHDLFNDSANCTFINLAVKKVDSEGIFSKKTSLHFLDLNQEILKNKIELVWFLTPEYRQVEAPFVLTIWDLQHRLQSFFPEVSLSGWTFENREEFYKNTVPKASFVVIGNKEGALQVEKFYNFPTQRIKTIPLPTPQFVFNETGDDKILDRNNLQKEGYLFYPAQFWPHKNHIRILKALTILKKQNINLKIVFTGSDKGNENYIKEKASELGLINDVKFLGFVSRPELVSLYKNAFALTFASMFGPDNIPPLEAMALSCPVICSNAAGMEEQLGSAALFFERLDENDLAQKILLLLKDKNLRNDLIEKGHKLAKSLGTDNYVKKIVEIVDGFAPIREMWGSESKYIHT